MVTVNAVRVDDGRLAEHWDVWEKEATRAESVSGLPMFGDSFPDER
jgi:predicted SnoaL-like aldol condensation-catalyzing enzyme